MVQVVVKVVGNTIDPLNPIYNFNFCKYYLKEVESIVKMAYVYKLLVSKDFHKPVLARCTHLEECKLNVQSPDIVDSYGLYVESMWELNDQLQLVPTDATSGKVLIRDQYAEPFVLEIGKVATLQATSYHGFHAFRSLDNKELLRSYLKYFHSVCHSLNTVNQT